MKCFKRIMGFQLLLGIGALLAFSGCRESIYSTKESASGVGRSGEEKPAVSQPVASDAMVEEEFSAFDYGEAHAALQSVFNAIVIEKGGYSLVNYSYLLSDETTAANFAEYLDYLRKIDVSLFLENSGEDLHRRDFRKAFWMNVYNTCVIRIVRDNYDLIKTNGNSITAIEDVWTQPLCPVGSYIFSLNQVEHSILRNGLQRGLSDAPSLPEGLEHSEFDFTDIRTHFAVNCASGSCPMLSRQVFTSENMEKQLAELESRFWNSGKEARAPFLSQIRSPHPDRDGDVDAVLLINPIFSWFEDDIYDFYDGYKAYLKTVVNNLSDLSRVQALSDDPVLDGELAFFEYDWQLNDTEDLNPNTLEKLNYLERIPAFEPYITFRKDLK